MQGYHGSDSTTVAGDKWRHKSGGEKRHKYHDRLHLCRRPAKRPVDAAADAATRDEGQERRQDAAAAIPRAWEAGGAEEGGSGEAAVIAIAVDVDVDFVNAVLVRLPTEPHTKTPRPTAPATRGDFPQSGDRHVLRLADFNGTVERVYAPSFGISSDTAKPLWFQSIFADEAAYHCTLALMQASNEAVLGASTGCVLASSGVAYARYVAESLRQLKRLLAGPKALANSTILLVLMFISQEQMRHESRNARVHVAGLQQMVALRGGLSEFETRAVDRPLLLKICKVDIVYALQFGTPPLFYRDVLGSVVAELDVDGRCVRTATSIAEAHHLDLFRRQAPLYDMLCDVLTVALLFETELPQRPIDVFTFGDIFSSLCYRLLRMGLETYRGDRVDDLYHLGMTMFSMALFLRFDQGRLLGYQPIGRRFRAIVEGELPERSEGETDRREASERSEEREGERSEDPKESESSEDQARKEDETCFWVMMMGGTWTQGDWSGGGAETKTEVGSGDCPGRLEKARKVRQVADRLGLASWDDARSVLVKYPWLTVLHGQPGRALWEASRAVGAA